MTAPDIAMAALADRQYARALDLVQRFRAASVALVQRYLDVDPLVAEALLMRMSQETTLVRRMPDGLYLFVGDDHRPRAPGPARLRPGSLGGAQN